MAPFRQTSKINELMYDFRQTAGVLCRSLATSRITSTMHAFAALSLVTALIGRSLRSSAVRTVAVHVRKSFAVKSAPMTVRR